MKRLFFTAGPSQLYPTVPSYIAAAIDNQVPSWSHRGREFAELFTSVRLGLKKLLGVPGEYEVLFFSSATEIWERLIQNCVDTTSFHFVNGEFGHRFRWTAQRLGRNPLAVEVPQGEFFDLKKTQVPNHVELIAITHNESSSGVAWTPEEIEYVADANPDALIAVDGVSSIPYPALPYKKIDAVYFSVQKGFGLPAGLGVCILSPRALRRSQEREKLGTSSRAGYPTGSYHSFPVMLEMAAKGQTVETPNVLAIYLLDKVIEEFRGIGLKQIRRDTEQKADMLYSFFDRQTQLAPAVPKGKNRSATLIVVNTTGASGQIIEKLLQRGIEVGCGYGKRKNDQIRIANFPAHARSDVQRLIDELSAILKAQ